jgi:hypothetical protein
MLLEVFQCAAQSRVEKVAAVAGIIICVVLAIACIILFVECTKEAIREAKDPTEGRDM